MIRIFLISCFFMIAACSLVPERVSPPTPAALTTPPPRMIQPQRMTPVQPPQVKAPTTPVLPPQRKLPLSYQQRHRNGITLSMVSYDDRELQLRVADQQNGLGSRWQTAQEAAATYGGLAAVNGGFFTPQGQPLGLLIETGSKRGYLNQSSLGAGIFVSSKTKASIIRREAYAKTKNSWNAYNLLQTGPMLAENGKVISGLSDNNRRPRSFIAWDGQHHWAIGHASSCTLSQLSQTLAGRNLAGFDIKVAVNLDGGRSSDLWASPRISRGGKTHRGFLNKPVRNYLVLVPRSQDR